MDTRLIEYIVMIDREKSIARAAEKLYITQPALTQQLNKLEHDLGIKLFIRTRGRFVTTEVGRLYVACGERILNEKRELYKQLEDLSNSKVRSLRIGVTPSRGMSMFLDVYPRFYAQHPNVSVNPLETNVRNILKMLCDEQLDMGVVTCSIPDMQNIEYTFVKSERFYLVISKSHPLASAATPYTCMPAEVDLSLLSDVPFCMINKDSTQYDIIMKMLHASGVYPHVLLETANCFTQLSLASNGLCCAILPEYYIVDYDPDKVAIFQIANSPAFNIYVCRKKDRYFGSAERAFQQLIIEYFQKKLPPWMK